MQALISALGSKQKHAVLTVAVAKVKFSLLPPFILSNVAPVKHIC